MNTTLNTAAQTNLKAALNYYGAMQDKDFENNKIIRIELFYDARAFEMKKDDIFSGSAS